MSVVINDFEVVAEPAPAAQPAPQQPASRPPAREEIERAVARLAERRRRLRAH